MPNIQNTQSLKAELNRLKDKYLRLSNLPTSEWNDMQVNELVSLATCDARVEFIEFLSERDEKGRPLFNVKSKGVSGKHTGATIASRLHESQDERKARLENKKYMDAVRNQLKLLEQQFFDDEITIKQAKEKLAEIKRNVPINKDGVLWQATFGIHQLEKDFDDIERFEKECGANKVTQHDILQVIHHYRTGRRMSEKVKAKAEAVGTFFHKFFNTPETIFDYSGFQRLYRTRW